MAYNQDFTVCLLFQGCQGSSAKKTEESLQEREACSGKIAARGETEQSSLLLRSGL